MTTLHIEHAISDYGTWRAAFDALADVRRRAGVIAERIARPIDDPFFIVVDLDFESPADAAAFLQFLETQIWTSATSAPALAGRPRTALLEPAPFPPR